MMLSHENDCGARVPGSLVPRVWTICLDFSATPVTLVIEGSGCRVEDVGGLQTVSWDNCGHWEPFIVLKGTEAYLTAIGGHVCPIYACHFGNTVRLSNVASRLMQPHDALQVDAFILLQNITGIPYPQNNFFKDIQLLEASGEYRLSALGMQRLRSVLEGATIISQDAVLDMAIAKWDVHLSSGVDIAVLLSGGYDSRLNLAIACHAARRFGNRVHAFHEHKNTYEESIAIAVADAANVPLTIKKRDSFVGVNRSVIMDPSFVDLQSGFYRDNLIRWHHYLAHIHTILPGCLIMGMGAEAHKGKYYRKVESISQDAPKIFGIDEVVVRAISRKFGLIHADYQSQQVFFQAAVSHASSFMGHAAQVDFLHYQTYVANGYGHRCHDVQQYFGMPFPLLENDFLSAVFALPRSEKEGFSLVTKGIQRLMPQLCHVAYTSANEKALDSAPSFVRQIKQSLIRMLGVRYFDWVSPKRKGRVGVSPVEFELLNRMQPSSPITALLITEMTKGVRNTPFIRLDYLMQACIYLNNLEKYKKVSLCLNSDLK